MSSRRRRNDPGIRTPLPLREERHRGCLLLSLIVLIGNIAATGIRAADPGHPGSPVQVRALFASGSLDGLGGGAAVDAAGRPPLRLRQKYLLGYRVDVNRAGVHELSGIPGISDETAAAWVAERARLGRFRRPRELLRVRGIKEKRLKKILPFLTGFHNN